MKTKNSQAAEPVQPATGLEQAPGKIRWTAGMIRGQALIIVLLFLVLCTFIAIAFLTNVTSSGVGENASASENHASQLAATAVQLVEGTITNATVSGTYPTVAWACQPGMIRTYGKVSNGIPSTSSSSLAYYKLYSSGTMEVTSSMDMNPNAIFSADVPSTWDQMPSYYTDLNAPLFVSNPSTSGTTEVFPIADPRAADSDIAVSGFSYSKLMPNGGTVDGVVSSGTSGVYANDTTSRLPMPVAWIYVLKDGTLTVPPPPSSGVSSGASWSNGTNAPTPTNPIVGRIAFWTDDECGKINVNTASEGTYWDTPVANTGSSTAIFTSGTTPIGDYTLALIEPAQHEYQRYPGHPATTCLSTVFGTILNSGSYGDAAANRAQMVKSITDAVPRISDYGSSSQAPANSSTTTMGGTQAVTSGTSVIVDQDRLYASLDEFQFSPVYGGAGTARTPQNITSNAGALTQEENYVDTCRFFLTAHSKAPELNMFGLPRVSMWPLWDSSHAAYRTPFDNEILRCSTVNSSGTNNDPHQMCFFRYDPTSPTNDFTGPTVTRNPQVFDYLLTLLNTPEPGYGRIFSVKYGATDTQQILTEIFDYIRSTNLADNSMGSNTPYTAGTAGTGTTVNTAGQGQVVPIQIAPQTGSVTGTTQGMGRFGMISELGLELMKVDDRANLSATESSINLSSTMTVTGAPNITAPVNPKKQTVIEWSLVPMLMSTTPGYAGEADNLRIKFTSINLNIGGQPVSAATTGTIPDLYASGQMGTGRDGHMGGIMGPTAEVIGAPSDSMFPTGLVVITGTSNPIGSTPVNVLPSPGITGTVSVVISGTAGTYAAPGPPIQAITFVFPPMSAPIPCLTDVPGSIINGPSTPTWWGTLRAPASAYTVQASASGTTSTFAYPTTCLNNQNGTRINGSAYQFAASSANADVVRTLVATGTMNGVNVAGDLRLLAISGTIPPTTFQPSYASISGSPPANPVIASGTTFDEGSIRWNGNVVSFPNFNCGTLVPAIAPGYNPVVPAETLGSNGPGVGDWDNGPGMQNDGPWANKPDEGANFGDISVGVTNTPYIGNYQSQQETAVQSTTLFSPNRQISSPVMFGSLPVGADHPWQTLLFHPATLPGYHGGYTHPGNPNANTTLPDHLLLDLFWMPVVEPYGISEPLATSGKINLNYQIAPFTYITRQTGLDAVLKSVMITALNPTACSNFATGYKQGLKSDLYNSGVANVSSRFPIDANQTLLQLSGATDTTNPYPEFGRTSHTAALPNFFVSATQICDVPLMPLISGTTYGPNATALSTYWAGNSLTGDNSLDRPYSMIYPRVTTKSNIFTVHVIAQSLKQGPTDLANGTWTENVDQVTGEVRGAYTIEKYYDPNADDLSYYPSSRSGPVASLASSDGSLTSTVALRGARWRLLNVKRFGQ